MQAHRPHAMLGSGKIRKNAMSLVRLEKNNVLALFMDWKLLKK